ncbi:MAG: hypothetical protein KGN79_00195 [Acidobacteriota bacterium]|nr:hypothetical protein [Acidobacteriota bacterium]
MYDSLSSFNWAFIQSHLPIVTLILVGAPLSLLLYKDFVRLSIRSNGKKKADHDFAVLAPNRDKDGMPVFVNVYGERVDARGKIAPISDFESRRVAAMRSAKSRY